MKENLRTNFLSMLLLKTVNHLLLQEYAKDVCKAVEEEKLLTEKMQTH